jgi:trk system potassium uptake protein TrkH
MNSTTWKVVLKQLGGLFILLGAIVLVPAFVSVIYAEWYSALGFALSALIIALLGLVIQKILRKTPEPHYNNALIVAAWGWLVVTFAGGLPFYVIATITPVDVMNSFIPQGVGYTGSSLVYFKNYLHCFFESMSAFTTTGLSMAVHEPSVGKGVLFYRSFAQWIGGAGFIVLALAILKYESGHSVKLLYKSESTGINLRARVMDTTKGIWKSYAYITLITIVYLIVGTAVFLPDYPLGDAIFDAINHAMAGLSSGGFSTLDDSIATYQSAAMDYLYLLPMMFGSFSLPFYYRIFFNRKFGEIWRDVQTRSLLFCFVFGGIILSLLLYYSKVTEEPFRIGIFQYISAISTTGWQTTNIHIWDDRSFLFIIFMAMFIGGAWGGTVGGIKIYRAVFIQRGMFWQIRNVFLSPNTVKTFRFDGKNMLPEEVNSEMAKASLFALMFLVFQVGCTALTTFFLPENFTFFDALFESTAAQSTAGLSVGITDPSMSPIVESIYIFQMWLGRLEIIPVLAVFKALVSGTRPYKH